MEDNKQPLTEVEIYNKWINKSVSKELEYSIKQAMNEFAKPLLEEISKLKEEKEVNDVNFERISTGQKQDIAALEISLSLSKKENEELKLTIGSLVSEIDGLNVQLTTAKENFEASEKQSIKSQKSAFVANGKNEMLQLELTSVKEQLADSQKQVERKYIEWENQRKTISNFHAVFIKHFGNDELACSEYLDNNITDLKEHNKELAEALENNKSDLLSICEYFISATNKEMTQQELSQYLETIGNKLNKSLNNYKK